MRLLLKLSLILLIVSCQQENTSKTVAQDGVSGAASSAVSGAQNIDFDKKKDDEACDTEEDLEKQIEAAKKKQEAFQLQGGDSGCSTGATNEAAK